MEGNCYHTKDLEDIIAEYRKSIIQSEAEVRSKFIVPLVDYLGYPSELRAEEFPVHGFEGGKKIPAKNADYLFFTDRDFAQHKKFSKKNQEWVYQHSLFVIEAKKPGEMPEVFGQPEFYTVWTRAVAYMITDGVTVKGYYYNPVSLDWNLLDCSVADLPSHNELNAFSYQNILAIKQAHTDVKLSLPFNRKENEKEDDSFEIITSEKELNLPEEVYAYMRQELGNKAKGLNKLQLTGLFLNSINTYLNMNVRYDVPGIMFNIPRETYEAFLYRDNLIFPVDTGRAEHFYWNEYDRYLYESNYITADIVLKLGQITAFEIGFHVFDRYVSERLDSFKFVKEIFSAGYIRLQMNDEAKRSFSLDAGDKSLWQSKEHCESMMTYWVDNLEKLKIVEDYYDIKFRLKFINGQDNLNALYDAIENVYAGIAGTQNCFYKITGEYIEDGFEIDEPTFFEDGDINLPDMVIHDVVFRPKRSILLPVSIKAEDIKSKDASIQLPACCFYDVANEGAVGLTETV